MKARYRGYCKACERYYAAGTEIVHRNGRWEHEDCEANAFVPQDVNMRKAPVSLAAAINIQAALIHSESVREEGVPPPRPVFTPSHYQNDIFDEIRDGEGHLVVEAGPGSGKTTTILEALSLTPSNSKVAFLAFNKRIAKSLKERAPAHVHVSTIHSLGLMAVKKFDKRIEVDSDKLSKIMSKWYPIDRETEPDQDARRVNRRKRFSLRQMVSLAKAMLIDTTDATAVADMVDRYNIELDYEDMDELIKRLPLVLRQCWLDFDVVDFDDMIWLPHVRHFPLEQFDYIFVDEAQDLNQLQIQFIQASVNPGGRIIAIGDRHQSLYAFRGADADAIPNIIEALQAKVMPLSISYRCPASHVRKLNELMGGTTTVEAAPNAKEGTLTDVDANFLVKLLEPGDMVVCRMNAPLIDPAFACVRAGKKAIISGREIGKALIELVERFNEVELSKMEVSMVEWYTHELQRLLDKNRELQAEILRDKVDTIRFVAGECDSGLVTELVDKLDRLFSDDNIGIVFSSVHRAKGMEADRVFILKPELMPHPKAKRPWELEQELNCQFVAYSRSKSELYVVT